MVGAAPPGSGRLVVKVGTSVLTGGGPTLHRPRMLELVRQIARLAGQGQEVVLVTSGAVLAGRERLGHARPGRDIPHKQMLAAVGQGRLMHIYEQLFEIYDLAVAQVLLTREDLHDRRRYLNARNTLLGLLARRAVPIVNENDAVATEEIRVGDNDNLSALVANLVEAETLILLTDTAGLYTADPRLDPTAVLIREVAEIDAGTYSLARGSRSGLGTGGMQTKVQAAELATRGGHRRGSGGWQPGRRARAPGDGGAVGDLPRRGRRPAGGPQALDPGGYGAGRRAARRRRRRAGAPQPGEEPAGGGGDCGEGRL